MRRREANASEDPVGDEPVSREARGRGPRRERVADDADVPRGTRRRTGRGAAAGAAGGAGSVLLLLARLVRLVAGVLALIIVAGILLIVLDANAGNSIVSSIHDAANSLVGPFDGIFTPSDPKVKIAINWGIAAAVYLVVGAIIASILARAALAMRGRPED